MKDRIIRMLCSTGVTLLVMGIIAKLNNAQFLCIDSIFQCFIVNVLIHLGFMITSKWESKYLLMEYMIDFIYTLCILLFFHLTFTWFPDVTVGMLIFIDVIVYGIASLLRITRVHQEIEEINTLLKKRKDTIRLIKEEKEHIA